MQLSKTATEVPGAITHRTSPSQLGNPLNTLAFKEKKNLSPSLRGSSQSLSANFRENSRNFHEKLHFFPFQKVLRSGIC